MILICPRIDGHLLAQKELEIRKQKIAFLKKSKRVLYEPEIARSAAMLDGHILSIFNEHLGRYGYHRIAEQLKAT